MKRKLSSYAQAAQQIRKELKQKFPNIKFSVTSEDYSMGNSVNIKWVDGPTSEEVKEITDKYQYGHFNGMEDLYEYSNKREDIAQSKFVFTNRSMSKEVEEQIIKEHNEKFCESGQIKDINAYNDDAQCWNNNLVYRKFNKLSLTEGVA